jgi:hypothetical protein
MQCTLGSLNLTFDLQPSKRDEWERFSLAHKNVKRVEMPRELAMPQPTSIYNTPLNKLVVAPLCAENVTAGRVRGPSAGRVRRMLSLAHQTSEFKLAIGSLARRVRGHPPDAPPCAGRSPVAPAKRPISGRQRRTHCRTHPGVQRVQLPRSAVLAAS